MVATEEGWHVASDGVKLYTKTWKTDGPPKAIIAFVHGFSDHCNSYYDLFPTLASYGIEIRAVDQRGWGRSVTDKASRGRTGGTEVVMSDIHSFVTSIFESIKSTTVSAHDASHSGTPVFMMGHSKGGAEVLYYALNSSLDLPPIAGVLAYSPLISLHPSTRPWNLTVFLGRVASKIMPSFQLVTPLNEYLMSRDKRICEEWRRDPLCHDTGTLEGIAGMMDRALWLESEQAGKNCKYKLPIWVCHGSADEINSYEASKRFVERLESDDKTFKSYEGAYHKLHGEPDGVKESLAKDVAEWIFKRCEGPARPNASRAKL
ncbi:lysophospholipase [Histoplasma capsulatum G186AR]|uniref:Lysophospholipase n=2 Tax=Ajellomyces capsulatus TaxID=5037 RepID=C0NN12_AJECG|nr:lysophospholipase [Histoplasma capsulatum G186AR]EEH07260.1 lysophospholipase [Histoplasma capsulatum G186AR]KAG5304616.1 lysophospholipase [Histoplasma capsulatum]QSS70214.1 lysophospholipase [Histoplasma capsulatum G186AR]